jgi:hypothetical protein
MSIIYLILYLSDYGDKRLFTFLPPIKNDPNKNCAGFRGTVGPREPSILLYDIFQSDQTNPRGGSSGGELIFREI